MSLTADHVSFEYGAQEAAARAFSLHDVSVSVRRGSLTGLLGPNGCGKTTLLRLMAGVLQPRTGSITLNGRSLDGFSRRELARHIAVVPQETHPAFDYCVLEMALMGRHPHLGAFQLEGPRDIAIAQESLAATGTAHLAHRPYLTLSGGEKQRVVIATALAQMPQVLLLDEPTASLDLAYQLEVTSLLSRLNRERAVTMVLATHDLNLAAALCDSLVLLRSGRVLAQGPTREVLTGTFVQQLYDVEADVRFHDGAGHLTVVPIRRAPCRSPNRRWRARRRRRGRFARASR
jgi:iron complex transport system ATP-binding protein